MGHPADTRTRPRILKCENKVGKNNLLQSRHTFESEQDINPG